jgi:protein-S-isoprenylcysteine O-methyltransferase Ste14
MIVPTLPDAILLLLLGGAFIHFSIAGGRTFFFVADGSSLAAVGAEIVFYVMGTGVTWWLALHQPVPAPNWWAAALLLLGALALYEWARHAIRGRRFGVAWGLHVPETLCEVGPYRHIRHPVYASYVLASAAELTALPHWITVATFLFNVALWTNCARRDERVIADSALAADYAAYRERTGMFLPVIGRRVRESR